NKPRQRQHDVDVADVKHQGIAVFEICCRGLGGRSGMKGMASAIEHSSDDGMGEENLEEARKFAVFRTWGGLQLPRSSGG
ncbi:hypothetical protein CVT26_005329, partial [Gymnopilus dilepis]